MPYDGLTRTVEALRAELRQPDHDPEALHDRLRVVIDAIAARGDAVPADLRAGVADLEAEILDAFHDNLPV